METNSNLRRATVGRLLGLALSLAALAAPLGFSAGGTTVAASVPAGQGNLAQYRAWMAEAKAMYPYPQSLDKMYRVMMCESTGNPNARNPNGKYHGLFQYHRGTWGGKWNPYRYNNIYDARSQIFATAKAWSIGMQSHWECYYITSGR